MVNFELSLTVECHGVTDALRFLPPSRAVCCNYDPRTHSTSSAPPALRGAESGTHSPRAWTPIGPNRFDEVARGAYAARERANGPARWAAGGVAGNRVHDEGLEGRAAREGVGEDGGTGVGDGGGGGGEVLAEVAPQVVGAAKKGKTD